MDKDEALWILNEGDSTSMQFREAIAYFQNLLDPKAPAGTVLCNAIMRIWPTPAFEGVLLREVNGEYQVYLRRRAENEAYPLQYHSPGVLYCNADESDETAAKRLFEEFGCEFDYEQIDSLVVNDVRGRLRSVIYLLTTRSEPRLDERHGWFPVNRLPEKTIEHHRLQVIPRAVAKVMVRASRAKCGDK